MSKEKFTPGPWAVNIFDSCFIHGTDKIGICNLRHKDGEPRCNAKANAALIAAAPEMYEALQGLLNQYEYENDFKPLSHVPEYIAAQKALAKARGEVNQPNEQP